MEANPINSTSNETELYGRDDVAWILTNTFLVLTMQSGFGLMECGFVSSKSISNIMFKNSVDVVVGGFAFWTFGYALSMGEPSNSFCGYGNFFFTPENYSTIGTDYTNYVLHFSFVTTSTTIISGAIAERMSMHAYVLLAFFNVFIYTFPASWIWGKKGFLKTWGFFDVAGASVVHMTGGLSSFITTYVIGPRMHRFDCDDETKIPKMSSPVTALSGMFILWWAWFGLSCGTTLGVSGDKWKLAAVIAANTINASIGGGCSALVLSYAFKHGQYDISYLISGVLGGLVGITTISSIVFPAESMFIGAIGGSTAIAVGLALEQAKIDDPVNAVGVHAGGGAWACLAVGLFGHTIIKTHKVPHEGTLYSGEYTALGIQLMGITIVGVWSVVAMLMVLYIISRITNLRMSAEDEAIGPDWIAHGVLPSGLAFMGTTHHKAASPTTGRSSSIDEIVTPRFEQMLHSMMKGRRGTAFDDKASHRVKSSKSHRSFIPSAKVAPLKLELDNDDQDSIDLDDKDSKGNNSSMAELDAELLQISLDKDSRLEHYINYLCPISRMSTPFKDLDFEDGLDTEIASESVFTVWSRKNSFLDGLRQTQLHTPIPPTYQQRLASLNSPRLDTLSVSSGVELKSNCGLGCQGTRCTHLPGTVESPLPPISTTNAELKSSPPSQHTLRVPSAAEKKTITFSDQPPEIMEIPTTSTGHQNNIVITMPNSAFQMSSQPVSKEMEHVIRERLLSRRTSE